MLKHQSFVVNPFHHPNHSITYNNNWQINDRKLFFRLPVPEQGELAWTGRETDTQLGELVFLRSISGNEMNNGERFVYFIWEERKVSGRASQQINAPGLSFILVAYSIKPPPVIFSSSFSSNSWLHDGFICNLLAI